MRIPNAAEEAEKLDFSYIVGRNVRLYNHFGELLGIFLKKLSTCLPHKPAIAFLGIYARNKNLCPHKNFICNCSKQETKCPSIGGCLNKLWYIHNTESYSAIRRNGLVIQARTGMEFKALCLMKKARPQMSHTI